MDDFEAPSFSLGLDEAHGFISGVSCNDAAPSVSESDFRAGNRITSDILDSVDENAGNAEADLHIESPPRSTGKILKRLKRGPSQACSGSYVVQHEEKPAKTASESRRSALQSFWKSLNDRKGDLRERDIAGEDDIEEYSSDDDFQPQEFGSQSARKLSLTDSAFPSGGGAMQLSSIGSAAVNKPIVHGQPAQGKSSKRYPHPKQKLEALGKAKDEPKNFRRNSDDATVVRSDLTTFSARNAEFPTKQSPNLELSPVMQCGDIGSFQPEYKANDSRLNALLRERFPHFVPVDVLRYRNQTSSERVYIDYVNQFVSGENAFALSESTSVRKDRKWGQAVPRKTTKRTQATRKKRRTVVADNEGWVQPFRTPVDKQRTGDQSGTGRWITEKSGKRIYITKDGTKLSGQSAYRQHYKVILGNHNVARTFRTGELNYHAFEVSNSKILSASEIIT